jgi:hypothetical protein
MTMRRIILTAFFLVLASRGMAQVSLDPICYGFDMGHTFENTNSTSGIFEGVAGQIITAGVDNGTEHAELGELAVCRNFERELTGHGWAIILADGVTSTGNDTVCDGRSLLLSAAYDTLSTLYAWNDSIVAWNYSPNHPIAVMPTTTEIDTLSVIDSCGCIDAATDTIYVRQLSAMLHVGSLMLNPLSESTYQLPVIYDAGSGLTECVPDSLQVTIAYDPTMFFPMGMLKHLGHDGNYDTVLVTFDPIHGSLVPGDTVGWLDGIALLGDALESPVWLDVADTGWMYSLRVTTTADTGSLTSIVCSAGGDRLIEYKPGSYIKSVFPNPSFIDPAIDIVRSGPDAVSLSVYSMTGEVVYHTGWGGITSTGDDVEEIVSIPSTLSSGAYYVILRSGYESDSRLILITR